MKSHIVSIVTSVIKKNKLKSILMLIAITGSILAALIPPLILERMVNMLSDKKAIVMSVAFMYLVIFAISGIFESLQNIMITRMGQAITHGMRSVMTAKLHKLPTSYFTYHETGAITSRFVNDVDAVDSLFTNGIISMVADAFKIISIMVIIFVKSKGLGIMMCVVTPILFVMTMIFQKRMRNAQLRNREAVAKVNQHVPETIQNIRMIRSNHAESFMEKKYDHYIEAGYKAVDQSNYYDSIYSPIIICVSSMMIAVMMICAANGETMQQLFGISVGSAVAIIAYVGKVFDPLESLGMEIQNIQSALAGVQRIDDFLNERESNQITEFIKSEQEDELNEKSFISFSHVCFQYEDGKEILHDQNFSIEQGENVVFTGRTGAGKTTLFKLLLGLYIPNEGSIKIGNKLSRCIPDEDRRKVFGYVEQHFAIIDGTIRDQITLYDGRISDKAVWEALEQSGLKDKILKFSKGIDTKMNANDFSQGELQLLSIARALVAKPQIMLLDEMTANLDSITERKILDIIHSISKGRTVLSISHRMSEKLENTRVIEIG